MLTDGAQDRALIREVVENWVLFRDTGDWSGFASVWHDDGWMTSTWFQGPASAFIDASREGVRAGVNILHFLGGFACEVTGGRAIAQTKMTIRQRAPIDGVTVDVTCTGRFYDFFERRAGRWAIVRRQPIYEQDRMDVVDPAGSLALDPQLLESFPAGYRHLAYLQERTGHRVMQGLPGLLGPAVELLYREGEQWLDGSRAPGAPHLAATNGKA